MCQCGSVDVDMLSISLGGGRGVTLVFYGFSPRDIFGQFNASCPYRQLCVQCAFQDDAFTLWTESELKLMELRHHDDTRQPAYALRQEIALDDRYIFPTPLTLS